MEECRRGGVDGACEEHQTLREDVCCEPGWRLFEIRSSIWWSQYTSEQYVHPHPCAQS